MVATSVCCGTRTGSCVCQAVDARLPASVQGIVAYRSWYPPACQSIVPRFGTSQPPTSTITDFTTAEAMTTRGNQETSSTKPIRIEAFGNPPDVVRSVVDPDVGAPKAYHRTGTRSTSTVSPFLSGETTLAARHFAWNGNRILSSR
jgi:hypothetical protein